MGSESATVGAAARPEASDPRRASPWRRRLLVFAAVVVTLWSLIAVDLGPQFLLAGLMGDRFIDGWYVLLSAEVVAGVAGMVGVWFCLGRRAYRGAVLFLLLQLPMPFVVEANRCDTEIACRDLAWLRLPSAVLQWAPPTGEQRNLATPAPVIERPGLSGRVDVYPAGAVLPPTFRDQAAKSQLGGHSSCFGMMMEGETCEAFVLDLYGGGDAAVVLVAPGDRNASHLAGEIFRRGAGGAWAKSGELVVNCPGPLEALRAGRFTLVASNGRDLILAGRQVSLLPEPDGNCLN